MLDLISKNAVLRLTKDIVLNKGEKNELRYRCIDPTEVEELPSASCGGYDVNELIAFSVLCREAGITPNELKRFCLDVGHAIDTAFEINRRELDRMVKETLRNAEETLERYHPTTQGGETNE